MSDDQNDSKNKDEDEEESEDKTPLIQSENLKSLGLFSSLKKEPSDSGSSEEEVIQSQVLLVKIEKRQKYP